MVEQIFIFYKQELSLWKQVYSEVKVSFYSLIIIPMFLGVLSIVVSILNLESHWAIIGIVAMILSLTICGLVFSRRVQTKVVGLTSNRSLFWNIGSNWQTINENAQTKLEEKVKSELKISLDKLPMIVEVLQRKQKKAKVSFPVLPVSLIAFLFPFWENYVSLLFAHAEAEGDYSGLWRILFLTLSVLLNLLGLYLMLRPLASDIFNFIFNRDDSKYKRLRELLENIHLKYVLAKSEQRNDAVS